MPSLLPPLASLVSLGCEDFVESLAFWGDVDNSFGAAFDVLPRDVFLDRLALTSGSTSGLLVSESFFLLFA